MEQSRVILVTGASRGIGRAIAEFLASQTAKNKLVLTARSSSHLQSVKESSPNPGDIEIYDGDISDAATAKGAVKLAISKFGRLDSLILNHGTLGEVKRLDDASSSVDGWISTFQTNFFSCVNIIKIALPYLRDAKGRIIMTSSGAALNAYSTWGAYGSSKAAMNHLALTLAVEEPEITTVAIRPGVVDSDMQREIRETHAVNMDEKDSKKFISSHEEGKLLRPEQPGHVMARLAVSAQKELSGKFLSWDDQSLKGFQSPEAKANASR